MISIPSCAAHPAPEETKCLDNASLTTFSSFSGSAEDAPLSPRRKTNPSSRLDWDNVEETLLQWFATKQIAPGHPQELIQHQREKQKQLVALKATKSETLAS